jgi:CheY-like chemotaxis protein
MTSNPAIRQERNYKRILVVDDNRELVSARTSILTRSGYETAQAFSGEEAIQVAVSFHPDFIVSDVVMSGINGVDAALEILQTLPQCKVLFVSGGYIEPLENARSSGYEFEVLCKPVPPPELLKKVGQIFENGAAA